MLTLKHKNNRPVSVTFADVSRPKALIPRVDHHIDWINGWVKIGEFKRIKIGKFKRITLAPNRTFLLIGIGSGTSYATTPLLANSGNEIFSVYRGVLPSGLTRTTFHYQQKGKNGGTGSTSPYQPPYGWVYFARAALLKKCNHVKGELLF